MNFGVRNMDKNWNIRLDQVCLVCGSQNFSPLTQKKHMVMWLMVLSLWKSEKYNDFFPRFLKIVFYSDKNLFQNIFKWVESEWRLLNAKGKLWLFIRMRRLRIFPFYKSSPITWKFPYKNSLWIIKITVLK